MDRKTYRKTLQAATAMTVATNTDNAYVADYTEANVFLKVSAVSGTTPTLDPVVEVSDDDGTIWYAISKTWIQYDGSTVTQLTDGIGPDSDGIGNFVAQVSNIGRNIRVHFPAPGGSDTPTFTIAVKMEAKN